MASALFEIAEAPALDQEYVGPVIFEDGAALDLFRYLLVTQLQGTPPEVPFDSFFGELGGSRNDAVRLKRRVLPIGWSVSDDPERDSSHPSSFHYDAEGTPASDVSLVEDGIVRFTITDNGCGMTHEELERVFDREHRRKCAAERTGTCLGLGLYVAKEIAEAHGGQLWGESAPGKGSRFTVEIPAKEA